MNTSSMAHGGGVVTRTKGPRYKMKKENNK
jgi:hypothetical protein